VATACAKPPAGRRRWTLALLADVMVKLTDHDSLSGETVRRRLVDNDLKPWRRGHVAQGHVVHSPCRWRIRRPHGRCARSLR
jgi:hypothetical protein